jgi:hypothetical protein
MKTGIERKSSKSIIRQQPSKNLIEKLLIIFPSHIPLDHKLKEKLGNQL